MSRSGYTDDVDDWDLIRCRGAVTSAIKGRRGQAFLRELLQALNALPEQKLIADEIEARGAVCAIGSVGRARGMDMSALDPEHSEGIAVAFGIADALAREIAFMNDECCLYNETPENRFKRMRTWTESQIRGERI